MMRVAREMAIADFGSEVDLTVPGSSVPGPLLSLDAYQKVAIQFRWLTGTTWIAAVPADTINFQIQRVDTGLGGSTSAEVMSSDPHALFIEEDLPPGQYWIRVTSIAPPVGATHLRLEWDAY